MDYSSISDNGLRQKSKIEAFNKEEHIYFDVELVNPISSQNDALEVEFDQSFNQEILRYPDRYKLTVARLYIPASEIPFFVAEEKRYSVSLEYDGTIIQQYLTFPDISTVRTVNYLLERLNLALQTAFQTLLATTAPPPDFAPFFVFNNATKQLDLYVENTYNQDFAGADTISIWFNLPLVHLLGVVHFETVNIPELSQGRSGLIDTPDLGDFNRTTFRYPLDGTGTQTAFNYSPATNSLRLPQTQGNCLSAISRLTGFVISSTSFGNRKELQNKLVGQEILTETSETYQSVPVVFDLTVDEPGSSLTETFTYTPSLYRWIDIHTASPINRVQFKIFYRFSDGNIYPLKLGIGRTVGIKFLFHSVESKSDIDKRRGVDSNSRLNVRHHL